MLSLQDLAEQLNEKGVDATVVKRPKGGAA